MNTSCSIDVDGHTIQEFQRLLELRQKYMNQTSENVLAASAIDILRSLRAQTRIAKLSGMKIKPVYDGSLQLSFSTKGKLKTPCLRTAGKVHYYKKNNERILFNCLNSNAKVYRWTYEREGKPSIDYIVVAASSGDAQRFLKEKMKKRIMAYRGLARKALSTLMAKTATVNVVDNVNSMATRVANEQTSKIQTITGGFHTLELIDSLDYATLAFKTPNALDVAMKKAANKMVSKINLRCKKLLDFQKLELPFPEVRSRK